MNRMLLVTGTFFGMLAIILGAFAAHGLEKVLTQDAITSFNTGVRYQMYHALLLLLLGGTSFISQRAKTYVFWCIAVGVVFFSGSIYGLATNSLTDFDFKTIALITPFGGLFMIIGWLLLLINSLKFKRV